MNICYFVHDITHPDISRRVAMLQRGGAKVAVLGFHRDKVVRPDFSDVTVVDLGRTKDGDFRQRILSILRTLLRQGRYAAQIAAADVVLARNLDMLVLGAAARGRFARGRPLIYECLDIHRFMTRTDVVGGALRRLEGTLLKRCQGLMSSSPGFIREYFVKMYPDLPPSYIVENKVALKGSEDRQAAALRPLGPPWRMGWYGLVRCRRSLELLKEVLRREPGLLEVVVAGRPSVAIFGDVEAAFEGLTYVGPFANEAALAELFASVHFAWTMDFSDEGANSDWLLPNRLYRAIYYGAVPIALASTETGRWLQNHHSGICLHTPTPDSLIDTLKSMTPNGLAAAQAELDRIPRPDLVTELSECLELVESLGQEKSVSR